MLQKVAAHLDRNVTLAVEGAFIIDDRLRVLNKCQSEELAIRNEESLQPLRLSLLLLLEEIVQSIRLFIAHAELQREEAEGLLAYGIRADVLTLLGEPRGEDSGEDRLSVSRTSAPPRTCAVPDQTRSPSVGP